jgi:hypothetical protein
LLAVGVLAQGHVVRAADPYKGTSSSKVRREATEQLPWDKLNAEDQALVKSVTENVSVFRRMPNQVIECEPNLYLYVVDHPEILANIWEILDIDQIKLEPDGKDTYQVDDGAGTSGTLRYLYRTHDTHLIYARGSYDGPLFHKPVTGSCVLLLRSGYSREPNGRYYVTCQLDAFIQLDRAGVNFLAKTFQPLVGRIADYNFAATALFMQSLSRSAEQNPGGTHELAFQLTNLSEDVRQGFIKVTADVADRSEQREALLTAQRQQQSDSNRTVPSVKTPPPRTARRPMR